MFSALFGEMAPPKKMDPVAPAIEGKTINVYSQTSVPTAFLASRSATDSRIGAGRLLTVPPGETNHTFASMSGADGSLIANKNSLAHTNDANASGTAGFPNGSAASGIQGMAIGSGSTASTDENQLATPGAIAASVPDTGSSIELFGLALATISSGHFLFRRSRQPAVR